MVATRLKTGRRQADRLGAVDTYLMEHFSEPVNLASAARVAGLHPNYLCTLYRSARGVSVRERLSQHRIANAVRLLESTDCTIKTVARQVGYRNLRSFQRCFKKHTGMTAQTFKRKTHRC